MKLRSCRNFLTSSVLVDPRVLSLSNCLTLERLTDRQHLRFDDLQVSLCVEDRASTTTEYTFDRARKHTRTHTNRRMGHAWSVLCCQLKALTDTHDQARLCARADCYSCHLLLLKCIHREILHNACDAHICTSIYLSIPETQSLIGSQEANTRRVSGK